LGRLTQFEQKANCTAGICGSKSPFLQASGTRNPALAALGLRSAERLL